MKTIIDITPKWEGLVQFYLRCAQSKENGYVQAANAFEIARLGEEAKGYYLRAFDPHRTPEQRKASEKELVRLARRVDAGGKP